VLVGGGVVAEVIDRDRDIDEIVRNQGPLPSSGDAALDRLVAEGGDPEAIVEAEGLAAIGGGDELAGAVAEALAANPDIAERLRSGDMKPIGVIVGHVMKATKGRADGKEVTRLVREQLSS
jgi:aspartyl-tRNA(Asn)/glutamyl-tRNA(Gln) amidotransferase subunit B